MEREHGILQEFYTAMLPQADFIRRLTTADAVQIQLKPAQVLITATQGSWCYTHAYDLTELCGHTFWLPATAWRVQGRPCQWARTFAQEVWAQRLSKGATT